MILIFGRSGRVDGLGDSMCYMSAGSLTMTIGLAAGRGELFVGLRAILIVVVRAGLLISMAGAFDADGMNFVDDVLFVVSINYIRQADFRGVMSFRASRIVVFLDVDIMRAVWAAVLFRVTASVLGVASMVPSLVVAVASREILFRSEAVCYIVLMAVIVRIVVVMVS